MVQPTNATEGHSPFFHRQSNVHHHCSSPVSHQQRTIMRSKALAIGLFMVWSAVSAFLSSAQTLDFDLSGTTGSSMTWIDPNGSFHIGSGSFSDGEIIPSQCTKSQVVLNPLPATKIIDEGAVYTITISIGAGVLEAQPAVVSITPPVSLGLNQSSFLLGDAAKDTATFVMRVVPSQTLVDGQQLIVMISWGYVNRPDCLQDTQTLVLTLKRHFGGTGTAQGDPHFRTIDGAYFDFYETGVFRLAQSRNLEIQGYTQKCGVIPSCFYGISIAFGDSLVRFFFQNGKLVVAKGTNTIPLLSVEQNANVYRVFILSDPGSYVDVTVSGSILNFATVLSSYFTHDLSGMLGNANGIASDDDRLPSRLVELYRVSSSDNLFNCVDCSALVKPKTDADLIPMTPIAVYHQGYTKLADSNIHVAAAVTNNRRLLRSDTKSARAHRQMQALNETRVQEVCEQTIASIPLCDKYVENPSFYSEQSCVQDTLLLGQLSNIDDVKLSYLRECRRLMDSVIVYDDVAPIAASTSEALEDRQDLNLANSAQCPQRCLGRGKCLLNGCKCNAGYTGLSCEIVI